MACLENNCIDDASRLIKELVEHPDLLGKLADKYEELGFYKQLMHKLVRHSCVVLEYFLQKKIFFSIIYLCRLNTLVILKRRQLTSMQTYQPLPPLRRITSLPFYQFIS